MALRPHDLWVPCREKLFVACAIPPSPRFVLNKRRWAIAHFYEKARSRLAPGRRRRGTVLLRSDNSLLWSTAACDSYFLLQFGSWKLHYAVAVSTRDLR